MPKEVEKQNAALYRQSSYRESLVEHLFLGELLRTLWPHRVEVMKPEVDDGGYDLVLEAGGRIRHVQLKSSVLKGKTSKQKVRRCLKLKPSGCVVWIQFDDKDCFKLGPFLWFGNPPGQKLPDLTKFDNAKALKADRMGKKKALPKTCVIPKGAFRKLDTIGEVAKALFGELA